MTDEDDVNNNTLRSLEVIDVSGELKSIIPDDAESLEKYEELVNFRGCSSAVNINDSSSRLKKRLNKHLPRRR